MGFLIVVEAFLPARVRPLGGHGGFPKAAVSAQSVWPSLPHRVVAEKAVSCWTGEASGLTLSKFRHGGRATSPWPPARRRGSLRPSPGEHGTASTQDQN
jgi:hypothetical protein